MFVIYCILLGLFIGIFLGILMAVILVFGKADIHELPVTITAELSPAPPSDPEGWQKYFPTKPECCTGACNIREGMMISCEECGVDNY